MFFELLSAIGGLGLFLLGMMVMTEGLKGLAGQSLRRLLTRFTRTPVSAAATGAAVTALVQSSSATTVTAVGFVGAGLLTFTQALGIIFGANIGTTITGWLVALIGFKLSLSVVVLPLILIGVLMRLFGRGKVRFVGWALAGFSLLFLGIDAMQEGMAGLEGAVTPDDFPGDSIWGRLKLVGIGIAITLVTQSSSAGIATALVALSAGAISFPQAAAMVIGMDVGTTFTAALATLGGSTESRRTGYAHVIYNVLTGAAAFFLLTPYVALVAPWIGTNLDGDPQVALVAFHTTFNLFGVLLVLPFTAAFARLIIWLVPVKGSAILQRLDDRLLGDADAAIDSAMQTLAELSLQAFSEVRCRLGIEEAQDGRREELAEGIDAARSYLERIRTDPAIAESHFRHQQSLHALDHLERLERRLDQPETNETLNAGRSLRRFSALLGKALETAATPLDADSERALDRLLQLLHRRRHGFRQHTIEKAARSGVSGKAVLVRLDSFRWLLRVTYHAWRIAHHFCRAAEGGPAPKS